MNKLMCLAVVCAAMSVAAAASLKPRDEAAELLLETSQLDAALQKDNNEHAKRSFGSSYSPAYAYEEPHVPDHYPASHGADLWGFKRAIINAIFTAARAVAGGSIAVKGQVIKGAGNLVAAQGKLIASGGQTVADFGRGVASKALYSAPKLSYAPSVAYAAPVATYGAPNAYVSSGPSYYAAAPAHNGGVLNSLYKAKLAKVNVATSVASAAGNAVAGAAGAVAGAVGHAAHGAARLAVGAAAGAANIAAGAAHGAANLAVGAADAVSNHVAHKLHTVSPAPAYVSTPAVAYKPYAVPTYGGSLEDSFGQFDDSYRQHEPVQVNIQPSLSYDLYH
ncbi:uncharacterized protein LOC132204676 isoform X1 [Neocloeon triangulifer]|uniref:uncharacterized protein LOC132204676 isoform X1 n=2 Tax=Neocloeon triangulifer TaxID=2078957 RepID=UPI00286F6F26|nr:uncharacterized protein LOC132204676 isoform X1 [Neocloeon triangulifer]